MGAVEYVRWGVDALSRAFRLDARIRSVQATYLSEVFEADEVDIAVAGLKQGYLINFNVTRLKEGLQSLVL
ncbi:MAG: hypothetical protein ISS70_13990 [Phycisphaerae bacterium]|nr:hypothetical protein [Phycisphaerae bacterium]